MKKCKNYVKYIHQKKKKDIKLHYVYLSISYKECKHVLKMHSNKKYEEGKSV